MSDPRPPLIMRCPCGRGGLKAITEKGREMMKRLIAEGASCGSCGRPASTFVEVKTEKPN